MQGYSIPYCMHTKRCCQMIYKIILTPSPWTSTRNNPYIYVIKAIHGTYLHKERKTITFGKTRTSSNHIFIDIVEVSKLIIKSMGERGRGGQGIFYYHVQSDAIYISVIVFPFIFSVLFFLQIVLLQKLSAVTSNQLVSNPKETLLLK